MIADTSTVMPLAGLSSLESAAADFEICKHLQLSLREQRAWLSLSADYTADREVYKAVYEDKLVAALVCGLYVNRALEGCPVSSGGPRAYP